VREMPRDVHGERARSDDKEDRGTDDRGGALHGRSILNAAASTTFAGITGFAAFPRIESDNTSSRIRSRLGPAARL